MKQTIALAVDLGGTNLRIGAVNGQGEVLQMEKIAALKDRAKLLEKIAQQIDQLSSSYLAQGDQIAGIALGFPGIVDPDKGLVHQSPHFSDWHDFAVTAYFKERFPWPVVLDNDANRIALGELWKGAGQGLQNFLLLTLGTGVGGAVVIQGKLFHGDSGFAGELGHICIEREGVSCECGSHGCLEAYVSATGIKDLIRNSKDDSGKTIFFRKFGDDVEHLSVQQLYEAARDGDPFAHGIFKQMGHYLGIGIASLVNAFGIFHVLIGGGVSAAADFFIPAAKKEMSQRTYTETAKRVQILRCQLGDNAGLIGGAFSLLR